MGRFSKEKRFGASFIIKNFSGFEMCQICQDRIRNNCYNKNLKLLKILKKIYRIWIGFLTSLASWIGPF